MKLQRITFHLREPQEGALPGRGLHLELDKTEVCTSSEVIHASRGQNRTSSTYEHFTWSQGIKTLVLIFLRYRILGTEGRQALVGPEDYLSSAREGSLAEQFEDQLVRRPTWAIAIFGTPILSFFEVENPRKKSVEFRIDPTVIGASGVIYERSGIALNSDQLLDFERTLAAEVGVHPHKAIDSDLLTCSSNRVTEGSISDEAKLIHETSSSAVAWINRWRLEVEKIQREIVSKQQRTSLSDLSRCARTAPSIVTRSDSELFGVSYPRFCIRVYLDLLKNSFINVRKLHLGRLNVPLSWSPRHAAQDEQVQNVIRVDKPWETPQTLARAASDIADSVLCCPEEILKLKELVLLGEDLHVLYGEKRPEDPKVLTTPYVSGYEFSGLCAQACCFIATTLLHRYCKGVYGISEITAIAFDSPNRELKEFVLHGLRPPEIRNYFQSDSVGLESSWQVNGLLEFSDDSEWLYFICRMYLASKLPLLYFSELNLLSSEVYDLNNEYTTNKEVEDVPVSSDLHCVSLIGCGRNDDGDSVIVFHDPSYLPYQVATTDALIRCPARDLVEPSDGRNPALRGAPASLLAIHPSKAVSLPLFPEFSPADGKVFQFRSLYVFTRAVQNDRNLNAPYASKDLPGVTLGARFQDSEYRLCQLKDIREVVDAIENFDFKTIEPGLLRIILELDDYSHDLHHRWVWLQVGRSHLWIWDAEFPVSSQGSFEMVKDAVLFAYGPSNTSSQRVRTYSFFRSPTLHRTCRSELPKESDVEVIPELIRSARKLQIAVISSFTTGGLREAMNSMPRDCNLMDFYAFMTTDIADLILPLLQDPYTTSRSRRLPAFHLLAECYRMEGQRDEIILQLAENIAKILETSPSNRISICGLSTYIPELTSFLPTTSSKCVDAFKFLLSLGKVLNQRFGQNIHHLEAVLGSRIDGIFGGVSLREGRLPDTDVLVASMSTATKMFERARDAIGNFEGELEESGLKIAFEIEPGFSYALNSVLNIEQFLDVFSDSKWASLVGVNVDVGHLAFISGVCPREIFSSPTIQSRIVHAHLSDHSKGHFGDVSIGNIRDFSDYEPWLVGFSNLAGTSEMFSGICSIENEACKRAEYIDESYRKLSEWNESLWVKA